MKIILSKTLCKSRPPRLIFGKPHDKFYRVKYLKPEWNCQNRPRMRKGLIFIFYNLLEILAVEELWKFELEVTSETVARSLTDLDQKFDIDWLRPHSGPFFKPNQRVTFLAKSENKRFIRRQGGTIVYT